MRVVNEFPNEVVEKPHVTLPLSDGTKLAAQIWMPADAEQRPVPAILEYIPYRKRDLTAARDALHHPYFAGHGYAAIRVDLRGSGDSEGVLTDEYLELELKDGEEILRWIAQQPWCSGKVGMIGISWGGFNGLQLAARRPPELGAVITVCSTDDRYADDVHYMGGCLLSDNLSWAANMFAHTSLPPDPKLVGDKWKDMWLQRLEGSGLWLKPWLDHQHRDEYWKHGSICEDYSAVEVPVMAVSGWADGYSNAVFRMLEHLKGPRKGLVGPWSHKYPHLGLPGPAIGFLQECLRWWDRWLKEKDTGIDREPMLHAWMQDHVPPTTYYHKRPGRWVTENAWPSPNILCERWKLQERWLVQQDEPTPEHVETIESPLSVGLFAGKWCSFSATPDLPHDQREEDGGALVFESEPLGTDVPILGSPVIELMVSSSQPVAMVAARLSCVSPDDQATRVTYGLLNLTHRDGHGNPKPLEPDEPYRVRIELNEIAQVLPYGHRIRLSLSTSYWPVAWAPPKSTRLTIRTHESELLLPVRQSASGDPEPPVFGEPEAAPPLKTTRVKQRDYDWLVKRDLARDISTLEVVKDEGAFRLEDIDLRVESKTIETYSYRANRFGSVRGEVRSVRKLKRRGWEIETHTRAVLSCDKEMFYIQGDIDAYEGDRRIYCRSDYYPIKRNLL